MGVRVEAISVESSEVSGSDSEVFFQVLLRDQAAVAAGSHLHLINSPEQGRRLSS